MSDCPYGVCKAAAPIMEGSSNTSGRWKIIDGVFRREKDCKKCPEYNICKEWKNE